MNHDLRLGDCRSVLADLQAASFDSCITDPPYELGFMGAAWDRRGVSFDPATWAEVARVLKPGAFLLAFGGTRTVHRIAVAIEDAGFEIRDQIAWLYGQGMPKSRTQLKPGFEPIIIARKPFRGSEAANVAEHGTGGMFTDAGRIAAGGRWPANVALDDVAAAMLDEQSGRLMSGANPTRRRADQFRGVYADFAGQAECTPVRGADAGGASRFFYCAKASRVERDFGLGDVDAKPLLWSSGTKNPGSFQSEGTNRTAKNNHPTVKPVDLMRWLVRLATPPGGLIVDPFCGSGTTGIAADAEGVASVLIDDTAAWLDIAEARIVNRSPLTAAVRRS